MTEYAKSFRPDTCIRCGSCSRSCPSCRSGGIDPQIVAADIIAEHTRADIWKCLQCRRCTAACPRGIDTAGLIRAIRENDIRNGNVPDAFRKTAEAFARDGRTSLPKGRAEKLRKDLHLPDIVADDGTIEELRKILKETGGLL